MSDMTPRFPSGIDTHLRVPLTPAKARLSEAESPEDYGFPNALNENSHPDLHHAENESIRAIERAVQVDNSSTSHDHSDPWDVDYSKRDPKTGVDWPNLPDMRKGRQLRVQNTHVFKRPGNETPTEAQCSAPDTDYVGIHHSLGSDDSIGPYQAVSGGLWRRKGLNTTPDGFFLGPYPAEDWPDDFIDWPEGASLPGLLLLLASKMKWLMDDYNSKINGLRDDMGKMEERINNRIGDISGDLNALSSRVRKIEQAFPQGSGANGINALPNGSKIAIGNINVTSANAQHYIRTNNGSTRDYDLSFS